MNKSLALRAAAAAVVAASITGAQAAPKSTVSYVADFADTLAVLVDWNTTHATAHVTVNNGASAGTYTDDGTQRLVTLSSPISETFPYVDICGNTVNQTTTLDQVVFRPVSGTPRSGTAQVVEIGTITNDAGCEAGTTPFGSPTDAGVTTTLLDMTLRASTADLGPGAQLAGMTETSLATLDFGYQAAQQIASFGTGNLRFADTGDVVPATVVDGWYVLSFADGHQTGFTRLTRNATSGIESWLSAPWQAGAPARVQHTLMTQPNAAAGFGTRNQASRHWEEGLFKGSTTLAWFDLYRDLTGAFITETSGATSSQPATWRFVGANIQIKRSSNFANGWRQRSWIPIANDGKNHFVMESEDLYDGAGNFLGNNILTRVNYYVDEGKSVEPTMALAPAAPRALPHGIAR